MNTSTPRIHPVAAELLSTLEPPSRPRQPVKPGQSFEEWCTERRAALPSLEEVLDPRD